MIRQLVSMVCVLSLLSGSAALATTYTIQYVGPATNSGYISDLGLNDHGEVVGTYSSDAWAWTANGGLVQLNPLLAATTPATSMGWKINDAGQICGGYTDSSGQSYAYIYSASSGVTDLGASPVFTSPYTATASQAVAYRINASGEVAVGLTATYGTSPAIEAAVVGSNGTVLQYLGTVGGSAYGIDNNGDTCGLESATNACWYCPYGGTLTTLATLANGTTRVQYMSGSGQIVGNGEDAAANATHAMLWTSGTATPTDLGSLGGTNAMAYGVDDANGQVVGWSYLSGGSTQTAFVWSSTGGMVNLNSSAVVTNLSGSGFSYLGDAICVNDSGQIAGFGTHSGALSAFLLTPTPEPSTLLLAATGLVGLLADAWRKRK